MERDDKNILRICYGFAVAIAAYTCYLAFGTLGIETGWVERYSFYSLLSSVASVALGVFLVWLLGRSADRHAYFLAGIGELRKVTWPSGPDTKRMTIVVCVVVGVFSAILSVFDLGWGWLLGKLLTI